MSDAVAQLNATGSHGGQMAPGTPAHAAGDSAAPRAPWHSRPTQLIIICGIILLGVVIAATAGLLSNLRDRDLAEKERNLESLALVLAEQIDRSFQSIELIQTAVVERMQSLGIASAEDLKRQMSGYDTYQDLKHRVSALPHINAVVLTDAEGKLINFSRSWPIPSVKIPDQDPAAAFNANPHLTSFVGKPLRSPVTGNWVVPIARKFTGPNGAFLGVVTGVMELQYFEQIFQAIASAPSGSIALFRRDGILLVRHPRQEAAVGQSFPQSRFIKELTNSDHGTHRVIGVIDGQERLVSARSLAHYPVALVATTTVADALANWKRGAITMIGATLIIGLVIGGVVVLCVWRVGKKLREQNLQRDAALHNMSQGLVMFDSAARLVVCNDRYRQMYGFPPDLMKPGRTVLDLLKYRFANGTFSSDPEEYVRDLPAMIAQGKMAKHVVETGDGRIVTVTNQSMVGGGWVATHEDITEAKRQEASFLLLFKSNPIPMWVYDRESLRFLAVNDTAVAHYGYSREQFLAMTVIDIRPCEERERFAKFVQQAGGTHDGEQIWQHQKADATTIDVAVYSRALSYDGHMAALVAIIDVTARKQTEVALAGAAQELIEKQYAIDQAVIVGVTDVKGDITYVNDNFCRISGYVPEELLGTNHRIMSSGSYSETFFREMYRQIACGQVWRGELCNKAKDGSLYWVDTTIVPQLGPDGKPVAYMAFRIDITARKLAEAKISYMASHDALTGVGNRAVLYEKLEAALARLRRRQETFAVLLLDLDGFKHINDTLGHAAGDELLKELAMRLNSSLRETDILTRLGGDEFAVIQSGELNQRGGKANEREAAIALALRILKIAARPFNLDGNNVTVGTSIGIAVAPEDGTDAGELLKKADLALYRVKSEGRNNFRFFDEEMSKGATARLRLLSDMRVALTRNEFELYYQPVFDAKTRRPCGAEALVRWRHPVEGLMSPDHFIPLAEETGLMEPLGAWILEKACTDAVSWPDNIKVAINLSAVQFQSGKLFDVILCALVESGLPPERLELEITESVLMQNAESYGVVIQQLNNIGISIVLDDFGTGHSSLSYLAMFPFSKIKIDKSFTQGLTNRADCAAIVASVLTLARGLDIAVTAEGVETKQQFELLRAAGVHQMQGYLFARPGSVSELNFSALERKGQAVGAA
jgi:diguanylate cyclase (GGDEF)-like protein/PAS domain S-box-containing protein